MEISYICAEGGRRIDGSMYRRIAKKGNMVINQARRIGVRRIDVMVHPLYFTVNCQLLTVNSPNARAHSDVNEL